VLLVFVVHLDTRSARADDCNSNGIPDSVDVVAGTSFDLNNNALPDECDLSIVVSTSGPTDIFNVPDPTLAVGTNRIVATVNESIFVYDKLGGTVNSNFLNNRQIPGNPGFFGEIGAGADLFDPRTIYDQYSGRFVVMILENDVLANATWIDVAISRSSDPSDLTTAGWHKYRLNGVIDHEGVALKVDYPGLGVDEQAVYITVNLIGMGPDGTGVGSLLRVIDRKALFADLPILQPGVHYHDFVLEGIYITQPAHCFGPAPAAYFLTSNCPPDDDCSTNSFQLFTLTDPVTNPTLWETAISVPPFEAPQYTGAHGPSSIPDGAGGDIDASNGGLANATWRDGSLFTTHTISTNGKRVVRWYEFDTAACAIDPGNCLVQFGDVDAGLSPGGNPRYTFFPAITPNRCDQVGLVTALSSEDSYREKPA